MAEYKGSAAEARKASALEKKRQEQQAEFERLKQKAKEENAVSGVRTIGDRFQSLDTRSEDMFKKSTVGLVSAEEFKKKRLEAEELTKKEQQKLLLQKDVEKVQRAEKRKKQAAALSFNLDEDEMDVDPLVGDESKAEKTDETKDEEQPDGGKRVKISKDPNAATHFLPDRERELEEQRLRQKLADEWKQEQEKIKKEVVEITYSYWDGSGHRRSIKLEKGTTIGQFLEQSRRELADSFTELRGASSDSLMYIKEDLIIPHHYTFYDMIITKARGKSGPLFHFDVHDDVRLLANAKVEKDESHAGKIVTRAWYERNKHIFPASRWEVYDPSIVFEKYTIR